MSSGKLHNIKIFRKIYISYPLIRTRVCVSGVRNVKFSGKFLSQETIDYINLIQSPCVEFVSFFYFSQKRRQATRRSNLLYKLSNYRTCNICVVYKVLEHQAQVCQWDPRDRTRAGRYAGKYLLNIM